MPIQDRRPCLADAARLETATQRGSAIPLEANAAIVAQLNLLLGTPAGDYELNILAALKRTGLPGELLVVRRSGAQRRNQPTSVQHDNTSPRLG